MIINEVINVERWEMRYVGVFLLSAATLMLQVSYTRIFSVALWHHFVWMILSVALLGYGVSGTILSVYPKLLRMDIDHMLAATSALFSASSLLSYAASSNIPFDPSRLAWDRFQLLYIVAYYFLLSIPFILSGLAVVIAVEKAENRINKLYFSNLIGSAIGAVLVLPLFGPLTGSGVMVITSIMAGGSALFFALNQKGRGFVVITGWLLVLLIILPHAGGFLPVRMSPYKSLPVALRYPGARLLETRWNAFSRVDVVESGLVRYAPGLSLRYEYPIPDQIGVIVDGDNLNAITRYDGNTTSLTFTEFLPTALPYGLLNSPRVLVMGAGGGLGVLTAIYHGSDRIMAIEVNPIVVELVRREYAPYSGSIYLDGRVSVVVADSRSFIQGSDEEFDIIELSMGHGASASSTGIYALSENYLYTIESFGELIGHLSEGGFLCVSMWLLPPPREDVRIISLAVSALESLKILNPAENIAVIRSWGTITLLVGKNPLEAEEIAGIREFCADRSYDIVYVPGVDPSEVNIHNRFSEPIYYNIVNGMLQAEDREKFYASYLYDIHPTTDEKPFFFHFFKWDRLLETYESLGRKWQPLIEGGYLVPIALVQALGLSIIFILLPLRRLGRYEVKGRWKILTYFFCLGLGYMFLEVAMIQRFILLLGHPTYSISAVIFSLLLASGLGSYLSGWIEPGDIGHKLVLLIVGIIAPFYGLSLPLISSLLGMPIALRIIGTFIIITPLGFLLGMPFPLGIRMLTDSKKTLVPWAWATNGCASVLGSILPTILALSFGFSRVFFMAGASYIVGLWTVFQVRRG